MPIATVGFKDGYFTLETKVFDLVRSRGFPSRIPLPGLEQWKIESTLENARYINENYTDSEVSQQAHDEVVRLISKEITGANRKFPLDFLFKNEPRPYQWDALDKAFGRKEFALFMEMRTGKSFVDINLAAQYYLEGTINAWLIVLFPGAIKATWKIQLKEHCPVPYECMLLQSGKVHRTSEFINRSINKLKILVVGIESLSNGAGPRLITDFVALHRTKFTIDESTCIKNPKALTKAKKKTRTRLCWDLGALCEYRMILTGTPTTQGIEDLYSQFRFLNWQIIGHKSYFTFSSKYCVMGGFERRSVIGYKGVDKLLSRLSPFTYIISTEDAIGIPEEVFTPIYVQQSVVQTRLLKELGDPYDMSTTYEDKELEVETVLERMMRYQQIVGGHFPYKCRSDGGGYDIKALDENPKMDALKGFIATIPKDQKVIIWARFVPELTDIINMLEEEGESHILYRGLSDAMREMAQEFFMKDDGPRFWVASQQESARGVELASASIHIFYSNSFDYSDRKQAEMRTNSSHQKSKSITYVDIVMDHKIDKQINKALTYKKSIADYVKEQLAWVTKG